VHNRHGAVRTFTSGVFTSAEDAVPEFTVLELVSIRAVSGPSAPHSSTRTPPRRTLDCLRARTTPWELFGTTLPSPGSVQPLSPQVSAVKIPLAGLPRWL